MKVNGKYKPFESVPKFNRTWPEKTITKAPIWCSVDLRDGNQALVNPMGVEQKLEFFDLLVKLGFKEIEVGFPSASDTEFNFMRRLIEENHVPEDVKLQVLCQAREHLIKRTFESLKGCKKAIFHLYNSTSPAQRNYTFGKSKEEIKQIAIDGIRCVKSCLSMSEGTEIQLEYSPESFSTTEIDYALEVCEAVVKEWGDAADENHKVILNLPTTVECALPNQFADQIEYFCQHISNRENLIISLHNHNDRGEGVAQCELGLLAGADRVEGCLFGNGERTGNLDIVNVGLNMFTQGIDPELDFSNVPKIAEEYQKLTGMPIYERMPYVGELVFTAFSGSHQDAIRKGMAARVNMEENAVWDVPYLTIDPHDIGRQYEGIIRINSQSGKGGAAYILEKDYGIIAPKAMHPFIGNVVKSKADSLQREISNQEVYEAFEKAWLSTVSPLNVKDLTERHIEGERGSGETEQVACMATVTWEGKTYAITGNGNGPLDAFVNAIKQTPAPKFNIVSFHEHSIGQGSDTKAMAYVHITKENGDDAWGVGVSSNVGRAGVAAVVSAINFKN
ncbi:MAG: 2-isopropylmalate synthase [Treponema sp.]|nr:2-isopropylmalate synthase [Spirochaetales bacterium]MDY4524947.1 2-isopropylmalate synthase [Treponema sp.]MDY4831720.1 2-isopropylmalate synthase [Treponema sp.]MDY5917137.1 2-isopropylmalate synthase [Treponema sp.]MDY6191177.1 2-isopropylmalate synthase [Treponema sp.]